ncbi:flavin monoamine oxidase family protein [Conexibacter sp. SYSU D00693]|uniref:flavin monoamine oxidase family protein n=1 Tax=Conexibacter sp. SYSU D00693 TaxID=2812560 RepID=UPI00196A472D|nr:flavin monoamine oxidase family protein [Conexibacter sp. SYSU D00693]
MEADVVVVGAGLAGLSAARALQQAGREVLVVEARDRVGGRTLNEPIDDAGQVVELGGQWVGPTQHRLLELARELGVATYPTHGKGWNAVRWKGRTRRYRGTIPWLSPVALADVGQAQLRLDRLARTVPLDAPWTAPDAERLDGLTFETWVRRTVATAAGRTLLRTAIDAVWAADARDVSLLHVLFYIHSAGGFDALVDTEGGAQQWRFHGGSQLLSLRLAERVGHDRILLGTPVRQVDHDEARGVTVRWDGGEARARRAVLAVPPALAGRLVYRPALPAVRDGLTQRMAQGSVIKCMAVYDEPFWRADGLSGQALDPEGACKVVYDNTPPSGSPGVLLGFLEGRVARRMAMASQDERRRVVLDGLAGLFGARALRPTGYVDKAWMDEEFSRGCYGGYLPPGGWTDFGQALRAPVGPLHWAGAETATVWNGYMDGAVSSGERAAREVLAALSAPEEVEEPELPLGAPGDGRA